MCRDSHPSAQSLGRSLHVVIVSARFWQRPQDLLEQRATLVSTPRNAPHRRDSRDGVAPARDENRRALASSWLRGRGGRDPNELARSSAPPYSSPDIHGEIQRYWPQNCVLRLFEMTKIDESMRQAEYLGDSRLSVSAHSRAAPAARIVASMNSAVAVGLRERLLARGRPPGTVRLITRGLPRRPGQSYFT